MWVNIFSFFLFSFIFILSVHSISTWSAIFHSALNTAIMSLSELVVLTFIPNSAYNFNDSLGYQKRLVFLSVFSKLLYFSIMFILSHFLSKKKESETPQTKDICLLLISPLLSIFVVYTFFIICYETKLSVEQSNLIMLSTIFLLIINIISWIIYKLLYDRNHSYTNLQLQLQKETFSSEHYNMLLLCNEEQRLLIHDIKKHLQSISVLNNNHEFEKIDAYITQLLSSSSLKSSTHYCSHNLLNAILCYYEKQCFDKKLCFHVDVRHISTSFMSEKDITSLFCNILDNAYEASIEVEDGYIDLTISPLARTNFIKIVLINSCLENPFNVSGDLPSKKQNSTQHGFGIKSIKKVIAKYHGEMNMYYEEASGTMHTTIILRIA